MQYTNSAVKESTSTLFYFLPNRRFFSVEADKQTELISKWFDLISLIKYTQKTQK